MVEWTSSRICDFCGDTIHGVLIDGKTNLGPWATMCETCHKKYGYQTFGCGIGQKYTESPEGKFIKTEG